MSKNRGTVEPNANPNADIDPNSQDPKPASEGGSMEGEIETSISAKQRVLDARGQEVPMDFFLYSCLEYERLLKARGELDPPPIQWPLLHRNAEGSPSSELEHMNLTGLLTQLCVWYRDEFPHMNDAVALDHEHAFDVVPPLFALNRDIGDLYKIKIGEDLPEYEASIGNNKFWDDIDETIRGYFSSYGHLFLRYVKWARGAEPVDDFEPGSRPPVGRYAPRMPRSDGPGGRGGPRFDRGRSTGGGRGGDTRSSRGSSGHDRGPRRDAPPNGPKREDREPRRDIPTGGPKREDRDQEHSGFSRGGERGPRPDGGRGGERGPRSDGGRGGERGPRHEGSRGGERRPPRGGKDPNASARLESVAVAEVDQAIEVLSKDSSLDEVTLKPQNSFYRRIQHQRIIDAGFHSFSVGEGNDRAVKVSRK